MKIVLRKEISNLGEEDSVVDVSDGYARNYLLPRGMAAPAGKAEMAAVEKRKAGRDKKAAEKKAEYAELADKLASQEIVISADAGEGGRLFGSVTSQDIALAIKEKTEIDLDKRKIDLAEPIKLLGEYKILAKLFREITAELKIKVIAK